MPVVHGYNALVVWFHTNVGSVNLSPDSNDSTLTYDVPTADITGYGSASKKMIVGQYGWKFDIRGFANTAAGTANADGGLGSCIASTTSGSILYCPQGSASGRSFYVGTAFLISYAPTANLGGGVAYSASFQGSDGLTRTMCA